jgi:hypothetical protein
MVHGAPATKDGRGVARLNVKEFFLGETIVNIRGSLSSLAKFPTRHEIMTYHGPEVTGPRPSLAPPAPRAPTAANAVPYGGQGREQRKEVRRRQLMASHIPDIGSEVKVTGSEVTAALRSYEVVVVINEWLIVVAQDLLGVGRIIYVLFGGLSLLGGQAHRDG